MCIQLSTGLIFPGILRPTVHTTSNLGNDIKHADVVFVAMTSYFFS